MAALIFSCVVLFAIVLTVLHALIALYLAERITRPKRWRVEGTPADLSLRHEEVEFAGSDGYSLHGWYLESPGARATVVILHDVEGTRADRQQGLLELQRDYLRRGLHVLSFDLRGHGESSGTRDQLGATEISGVSSAVIYAQQRNPGLPVVLHGFGLGAALALVAASRDLGVTGIIADSPFTSMRAYIQHQHPRVPWHLFALSAFFAKRIFNADINAIAPLEAVPDLGGVPVLYIHAEHDLEVPVEHTLNLAAASLNSADRIWRSTSSAHCTTYVENPATYLMHCLDFIEFVVPARLPVASAG